MEAFLSQNPFRDPFSLTASEGHAEIHNVHAMRLLPLPAKL